MISYEVECSNEKDEFWCRVESDHELTEDEKEEVKRAACAEEVFKSVASGNEYRYTPVHIEGVHAAITDDLVWDDVVLDYTSGTKEFNKEFKSAIEALLKETIIKKMVN